jgi:hypothetical protein
MRRRLSVFLALVCAAALVSAAAAYATFTGAASAAQSISTNTLQPPTGLQGVVASSCKKVTLTWAASSSAYATGYAILRNGTPLGTVPAGTATYSDSGVAKTTSYTYTVQTTFQGWTAPTSVNVTTC